MRGTKIFNREFKIEPVQCESGPSREGDGMIEYIITFKSTVRLSKEETVKAMEYLTEWLNTRDK